MTATAEKLADAEPVALGRPVLVTTEYRGVFFGYADETSGDVITLKNARNLMHQPLLGGVMEGQATDLEIEAREMLRIRERLYSIYSA